MRPQAMPPPDALHRTHTDAALLGHCGGSPVCGLAWRIGQCASDNALLDCASQGRDARRTGLVAQQTFDAVGHEPLLPPPDSRLAGACAAHDLRCAATIRRQQHDVCSPNMLLGRVPICHDRRKPLAISGAYLDDDTCAHAINSHPRTASGNPNSDSSVRFYPLETNAGVRVTSRSSFWIPLL